MAGRPGGDLEAFAADLGLTFRILHEPAGDIQRVYQTTGVPETFVIDRQGIIVKKVAGTRPGEWVVVALSDQEKKRQPTIRGRILTAAAQEGFKVKFEMRAGDLGIQKDR